MARVRSDRSMTLEELCELMDEQAPWPAMNRYIGDGGQSDCEMHAEAARRRIRVAERLGFDRFEAFAASHWRDLPMREGESHHG
ncbi:hypothetical protein BH20ACT8_BH20ACT8_09720 [soil metagenome]